MFIPQNTMHLGMLKINVAKSIENGASLCMLNTYMLKLAFYSEMSILAVKPKFNSCEGDFNPTSFEIQNKVTMFFVKNV